MIRIIGKHLGKYLQENSKTQNGKELWERGTGKK